MRACATSCSSCCRKALTGGFIIRTMAETASEREMQNDIDYLTKPLAATSPASRAREARTNAGLPGPESLAQRVLRDMVTEETDRVIQVDSRETFQKMQEFAARVHAGASSDRIVHHHVGERPLFDLNGVEDEIQNGRWGGASTSSRAAT